MKEVEILVQGKKRINDVASIYIEILPDGKSVRWCIGSSALCSYKDFNGATIEYNHSEEDENLEPRAFVEIIGVKHYIDEFVMVETD
jgi:hypothetical protein